MKNELELTHALLKTKKVEGNKLFYYRLHLVNLQKLVENEFKLVSIDCAGQPQGHAKLWIDKEEKVWIYDGDKKTLLEEFEFTFGNFLDGEFADFVIVDRGSNILAGTRIFPRPIECKTADGAVLSLQLRSRARNGQYLLQGSGFQPSESLSFGSQSEDEVIGPTTLEASAQGDVFVCISPWVLGKSFGHGSLMLKRQDGTELKLSYLWGIPEEKLAMLETTNKKVGI